MSFLFNWKSFDNQDHSKAKQLLTDALNKPSKPPILVDKIEVSSLSLGDKPPVLEILEIGDIADDRFRGIFKLKYDGNGYMTLKTKIQANPLCILSENAPSFASPKFKTAASPLHMPLTLTLSDIKLSGIIILVFSRAKGLTIVFRNDPLESLKVSSSFNEVPAIERFLQAQIENQIRILCREELPSILHKLSHRWTRQSDSKYLTAVTASGEPVDGENVAGMKPVSFAEINPGAPELSPASLLRLNTLCASQSTLSLFTPAVPHAVYRSNMESILDREKGAEEALNTNVGHEDVSEIARIQLRYVQRKGGVKPHRRVIKMGKTTLESAVANDKEKVPLTIPKPATLLDKDVASNEFSVKRPETATLGFSDVPTKPPPPIDIDSVDSAVSPSPSIMHATRATVLESAPLKEKPSSLRPTEKSTVDQKERETIGSSDETISIEIPEKLVRFVSQVQPPANSHSSSKELFRDFFSTNVRENAPPPYYT